MTKYKTVLLPSNFHWWVPTHIPGIIKCIEKENKGYKFVQIVTSPGHGGFGDFVILKRKKSYRNRGCS